MAARGKWRGHPMRFCESSQRWFYDDGVPVDQDPQRPCGHCGRANTPEGHDGCLGTLPGARNACCGHGEAREAYVQFSDDEILQGDDAIAFMRRALA